MPKLPEMRLKSSEICPTKPWLRLRPKYRRALCHADKSAGVLLSQLREFWPSAKYHTEKVMSLYPPNSTVIEGTLRVGRPHEQAVAMHILAEKEDLS